ncbi:sigma factor-like helix-turn-helix DNA-binding protein [Rhodococcus sp. T2V]|uniref:sigma factor-like helix-turn-helix DNA-binding protein n=1 Tax=Rhodococcus sp. T2V TaxID=3034164 RepID=UPI0023E18239|nr:sigma factor-like helix-turn-helix DNA-binding protein [Rhodococcus sp. T2V]MDF3313451.1 sigma factor-like helix-turn-helix DNA-binding protein [Rhodococcus sp. T2V]
MGAKTPVRRKKTARELAEEFGASPRTIQRLIAEPREDFLARAAERRTRAVELREQGLKHREIAEEMGISIGAVGRLLHDARKIAEKAQG